MDASFELTKSYDLVYNCFNISKNDKIEIIAFSPYSYRDAKSYTLYAYFHETGFSPGKILSNGKLFMAYEIVNRLEFVNEMETLRTLRDALTEREKKKQLHKVFKDSFDAKAIF